MELYLILVLIIVTILSKFIFKVNIKKSKALAMDNKELDDLVANLPENTHVCKSILKMINNEDVKIEEDKNPKPRYIIIYGTSKQNFNCKFK